MNATKLYETKLEKSTPRLQRAREVIRAYLMTECAKGDFPIKMTSTMDELKDLNDTDTMTIIREILVPMNTETHEMTVFPERRMDFDTGEVYHIYEIDVRVC
jgi:hypothetical protein